MYTYIRFVNYFTEGTKSYVIYYDPSLVVLGCVLMQHGKVGRCTRFQGKLCVLDIDNLRGKVLEEAHGSQYSIHLGGTKMSRDL